MEPVLLSSCQHSFCSVCLKKHFPQDVCPKCGMAAPPATVKTDHTSIELAAAAGDLVKMLQGKTIEYANIVLNVFFSVSLIHLLASVL